MHVFSTYKTRTITTFNDFTTCRTGQAGVVKKFSYLFPQYTFLFLRILFIRPMLSSNFSTKFSFPLKIKSPSIS